MDVSFHKTPTVLLMSTVSISCFTSEADDACARNNAPRPNFIIILTDDMGYSDIGCYGNDRIRTPNIDALARGGMLFTDAHSGGALSTPSRAALMTGRYPQRSGLEGVILENIPQHASAGLPEDEMTFADILSENGYRTCLLGKWHLGSEKKHHPLCFGFDSFFGFLTGNVDYFTRVNNHLVLDWWDNYEPCRIEGYTTTILASAAVRFIKENKNRPFCMVLSESCPHGPLQGPDDYALRVEGHKAQPLMIKDKRQSDIYKAMIEELDSGIGDIMAALKDSGIEDNTLVLFMSDNGPKLKNGTGSAFPFRGGKGSMFEGGHRVPFIAYMPGMIEADSVNNSLIMGFDIFPTMLEMAGIKIGSISGKLDGTSILPAFKGDEIMPRTLFWALGNKMAVRDGKWKYIVQNERKGDRVVTKYYLFDMDADPEEKKNLAGVFPDIALDMKRKIDEWHEEVTSERAEQLVPFIPSMTF